LVVMLWPRRGAPVTRLAAGSPDGNDEGAVRSRPGRLAS
jgi:hypothetical protein